MRLITRPDRGADTAGPVVPQRSGFRSRMMAPGWYRAAWMTLAGAAFCFGLVVLIRALYGDPVIEAPRS